MSFYEKNLTKYLTQEEIKEAKAAFKLFDQDGSGSISIRVNDLPIPGIRSNSQIFGPKSSRRGTRWTCPKNRSRWKWVHRFWLILISGSSVIMVLFRKIINKRTQKDFITAFRTIDYQNRGELGIAELTKANLVTGANLSPE